MASPFTKDGLAAMGLELAQHFCESNDIPTPKIILYGKGKYCGPGCGYYSFRERTIRVSVESCARPNVRYSWPGLFCDRTPLGVIQHELGHYIHHVFRRIEQEVCRGEAPITSYAPCMAERFAEIFRLFLTNPDLLRLMRPKAYDKLCSRFQRTTDEEYHEVLAAYHAPEYVRVRVEQKIH